MVKIKKAKNQKYLGLGKDFAPPIAVAQAQNAQELQGPFQMWSGESLDLGLFKPSNHSHNAINRFDYCPQVLHHVRTSPDHPSANLSYVWP